jgi:RNA polymerase sigma factor (sigma-70 family)
VKRTEPVIVPAEQPERATRIAFLVRAAKEAREEAVGELVTEFSPLLWQVARAAGLSASDAEDVVQTVWLQLLTHLQGIHTSAALSAWLVTTTRREAWRVRRAGRRQVPSDQDWLAGIPDPRPSADEQAIAADQRRELWDSLRKLSPRCRELLRIVAFVPRPDYEAVAAKVLLADRAAVQVTLQALDGAPLAHVAAHGHHDHENVLFSRLDLTDGPLMAYDVQGLSAAPCQVVLSACDVGRAMVRPGEEILGFTAALLYIGTSTVISSISRVADDAAISIMRAYHRALAAGTKPAEALAEAASAEPFSPFVCFGSG